MTTNATRRARQHKIIAEHEKTIAALRAENERLRIVFDQVEGENAALKMQLDPNYAMPEPRA